MVQFFYASQCSHRQRHDTFISPQLPLLKCKKLLTLLLCDNPNFNRQLILSASVSLSSSSSTNFIATQVLKQNFRAAVCHVLHYSCNVSAAVADSLHCRMIFGTVPFSVHAWIPPATAVTWSPAAAHSKPMPK